MIRELRAYLDRHGFEEVDTPVLAVKASGADIVDRALRALPCHPLPDDDVDRQAIVEGLSDDACGQLEALGAEFFAYPDDLTALLFDFVCAHPEEFGRGPA